MSRSQRLGTAGSGRVKSAAWASREVYSAAALRRGLCQWPTEKQYLLWQHNKGHKPVTEATPHETISPHLYLLFALFVFFSSFRIVIAGTIQSILFIVIRIAFSEPSFQFFDLSEVAKSRVFNTIFSLQSGDILLSHWSHTVTIFLGLAVGLYSNRCVSYWLKYIALLICTNRRTD